MLPEGVLMTRTVITLRIPTKSLGHSEMMSPGVTQ